jgi:hypothetical protein
MGTATQISFDCQGSFLTEWSFCAKAYSAANKKNDIISDSLISIVIYKRMNKSASCFV